MNDSNSHVIPFLEAKCKTCGHKFIKPYCSYGEIVFQTELGEDYADWYCLYDPVQEEIAKLIRTIDANLPPQSQHKLMAQCADPINGKKLTTLHCPNCCSRDTKYNTQNVPMFLRRIYWNIFHRSFPFSLPAMDTGSRVPLVTFQEYKKLDLESRQSRIALLYQLIKDIK